jgi:prepilin-type N-terminal cleavage/methylation domain-containing protein
MKTRRHHNAFTLVEILVVVGIIAVLATIVINITLRIETQSKENQVRETFALIKSALTQFKEYEYTFPAGSVYADLDFPPDCTGFPVASLTATLETVLGLGPPATVTIRGHGTAGDEYRLYSGCEALYLLLSEIPEVAQTLRGISPSLVTNANEAGGAVEIKVGDRDFEPLLRVVDPWGTTLRYSYYNVSDVAIPNSPPIAETVKSFPVLTSAGPDKTFDTDDDISTIR